MNFNDFQSEADARPQTFDVTPPPPGRLRVVPLGGMGEFGKNCTVFEYGDDMLVFDCGLQFPDDDMLGVDMVIPDFSYVLAGISRLRGLVLTHGHEDHIGAVPFFVRQMGIARLPIYGSRLTIALVMAKLAEHQLEHAVELIEIDGHDTRRLGAFDLEFLPVSHSMPMAMAVALRLPIGVVLHTGDYKFNLDEPGDPGGLERFARQAGADGVLLMLGDSTNVGREGFSPTERVVMDGLREVIAAAPRALVVACFSSSLHRVQTVIDLAREVGRKIAICGYSLERNFEIATRLGLIRRHDSVVLPLQQLTHLPADRRIILTTGTQGEPMSALSRLSLNSFRGYRVQAGDVVVMSSRIIPGNEKAIYRMINHFYRHGARVVTEREARVHASGHAYRGEMRDLIQRVRPRHLVPMHGDLRHLIAHRDLAVETGVNAANVFVLDNGMELLVDANGAAAGGGRWAGRVMVDGKRLDGVHDAVLRDRLHLSNDGMLTVILVIDRESHRIIAGPDIVSRGFVMMDESEDLIERCKQVVRATFEETDSESQEEWEVVKVAVRRALRKFLAARTDRYPVILPVVVEV
jgi:ribonuclease J